MKFSFSVSKQGRVLLLLRGILFSFSAEDAARLGTEAQKYADEARGLEEKLRETFIRETGVK